ncbi:hypothetical protein K474DRAFT_1603087 [Panus rudis PR-1116 ss-1]|nr:hypothetical protein K474DRAFT_1603087 [Panus rudis PR-1116 ss-1]
MAHKLNADCMALIFPYLSGNDLVSISLVNRSFLAGVVPTLYRTLVFTSKHASQYKKMMSAFATVLNHPHLAVHVRHIVNLDIRAAPQADQKISGGVHSDFLRESTTTLPLCVNLVSFTCTPSIFPYYLPLLEERGHLESLRTRADLDATQAEQLTSIKGLRDICLDSATWNVIHVFPQWAKSIASTLRSLTFYNLQELNMAVLEPVIKQLPDLTGLHIIQCMEIDHSMVLQLAKYASNLRSLAFTCWTPPILEAEPPTLAYLVHLNHLAVQILPSSYFTLEPHVPLFKSAAPLSSISLLIVNKQGRLEEDLSIKDIIRPHASTLTHLMLNRPIDMSDLKKIASRCKSLYRLTTVIPRDNVSAFARALYRSQSLQIVQDLGDLSSPSGTRANKTKKIDPNLSKANVQTILDKATSVSKVITPDRVWTVCIGRLLTRMQIYSEFDGRDLKGSILSTIIHGSYQKNARTTVQIIGSSRLTDTCR